MNSEKSQEQQSEQNSKKTLLNFSFLKDLFLLKKTQIDKIFYSKKNEILKIAFIFSFIAMILVFFFGYINEVRGDVVFIRIIFYGFLFFIFGILLAMILIYNIPELLEKEDLNKKESDYLVDFLVDEKNDLDSFFKDDLNVDLDSKQNKEVLDMRKEKDKIFVQNLDRFKDYSNLESEENDYKKEDPRMLAEAIRSFLKNK